jgi:hypothetical protein
LEECQQRKRKKNYRILRNELKSPTDKAIFRTCDEIMEFQRTENYDLMYLMTKTKAGNKIMGFKIMDLRLLREYNNKSEIRTKYMGELYYRSTIELIDQRPRSRTEK